MKISYPLAILSDTHMGHTASRVRSADQLEPLAHGVSTVVFNGDSVEMLWRPNRPQAREQLRRLVGVCRRAGARPIFVNGNHDPFVSTISHLDLAGGSVLTTHGDVLFHEVAPWSRDAEVVAPQRRRLLESMGADAPADFERQLLATKWASLALEMREPCSPGGILPTLRMALRETWPPWRVLRIVRFWMQTPERAVRLARMFRPDARFIVIGHTHHPGVWEHDGRVVVNTGAYLPFSSRLAVRVEPGELRVHRVVCRGGRFDWGRLVRRFDLPMFPAQSVVEPRLQSEKRVRRVVCLQRREASRERVAGQSTGR